MTSDSPRGRIDQFFGAKKRRAISPSVKSRGVEKDAKNHKVVSPSVKGSLNTYLLNSQDDSNITESVKRNLSLETAHSSKFEFKEAPVSGQRPSREFDSFNTDGTALGPSSELRQFATDFLSLYCSEVSTVSPHEQLLKGHKRQGDPSLLAVEDNAPKKRHCTSEQVEVHLDDRFSKNSEDKGPRIVCQAPEAAWRPVNQIRVEARGDFSKSSPSLRKCSKPTDSDSPVNKCSTPDVLKLKPNARETPGSTRGSSFFSPGDEFWNEAIQVADGLLAHTDIFEVNHESHGQKTQNRKALSNFKDESSSGALPKVSGDGDIVAQHLEVKDSICSSKKHGKDLADESSPIPVKHFDFSVEDKSLVENTPSHGSATTSKGFSRNDHSSHGSPIHKGPIARHNLQSGAETNEYDKIYDGLDNVTLSGAKKRAAILLNSDSVSSDSPEPEKAKLAALGICDGAITPSSSVPLKDNQDIGNWLPPVICNTYRKKGIAKLYPWQVDCLQVDGVLEKRNLVYCASTSAGKSFVAEILMLRRVITTEKIALLVLPYVSICTEKAEHLEVLLDPLGKHVRSYYGNQGGGTLPKDTSVAVCTIEKANSLINRLLEEDRLSELGIIVIDELHMVADPHRGYLLELLLTKLRYAAGEGNSESPSGDSSGTSSSRGEAARALQIVGMSATMPNVAAVADWLHAALYQTEFRPVPLEEYIKVANCIYNKSLEIVKTLPKAADLGGKDPDHVVEMCNEVVQEGHSVLLFCSSRKGCESTAKHVAKYLKRFSFSIRDEQTEFTDISSAIDSLSRCPAGLDPVLEETLPSGVAYHHAGLTVEEREIVEILYRKGLVRVLTATSTLAAGVNLPARRVLFRQPRIGRDFIDGTRYRQMAGRAGRTGIDAKGESVLICRPEELKRIKSLLNDCCPPLQSCLSEDKNGMIHAILEVVASGIVQTANDIHRYVRCTLLSSTKPFEEVVKSAQDSLRWLCHRKFLEWHEDTKVYSATPLGRAAFGSSLSPEESLIVLEDLSRAREGFVLASDLHLVYLVTPINVEVEPDWELFYERFMQLSALDQSVGNRVGVVEPFLMRMAHGAPLRTRHKSRGNAKELQRLVDSQAGLTNNIMMSDEQSLRVCKRFYVALMLSRLVQEVPVVEVCGAFRVARGMVQGLQENAGRFASMVSTFCERLGWHDLEGLVSKFQNRVSFGVRAEIVELTTIPYVKGSRARSLYKAAFRSPLAIAEASVNQLAKALSESSSWAVEENTAQRRIQLGVAKKIKNGARRIVLEKAEEARVSAFSAFKSLGVKVPQLSQPILPVKPRNPEQQEVPTSSSGEDNANIFLHSGNCALMESSGGKAINVGLEDIGKSKQVLNGDLGHVDVAPSSTTQLTFAADRSATTGMQRAVLDASLVSKQAVDTSLEQSDEQNLSLRNASVCNANNSCSETGPINVASTTGGIDSFLDLWDSTVEFFFDLHFIKKSGVIHGDIFEVHGIAICWEDSPVYYINFPKALLNVECNVNSYSSTNESLDQRSSLDFKNRLEMVNHRWNRIAQIMRKDNVRKFTWNLKAQIQVLKNAVLPVHRPRSLSQADGEVGLNLVDGSYYRLSTVALRNGIDMCIVAWILWPDEERSCKPNLDKEVKRRLSREAAAAANRSGRWKNQMGRAAHNGCCRRVAQTRVLCSPFWKLLISEELLDALLSIEIPLVHVLADMEVWGIGVNMEACLQARHLLSRKLKNLEKEAYKLAGTSFSLYMPADIANVLFEHLKLPIPEGCNKGKQHVSTDKHCLDLLRHEHPIIPVIKEHRTLAKLLNCTLGSMCSLAKFSMRTQKYTLHGHWLQTSTATGRLSMEEPNLQCVEHMVDFEICGADGDHSSDADHCKINPRDFFVPTQENWLMLTADYSQIELRLMAHFSRDSSLIELLRDPLGDVFTIIASKWTGKTESNISSEDRDQTKRLVYGILYGMGANSLAEQLNCSAQEARDKIRSFKSSFPGVSSWLQEAVAFCRQRGYVLTLKGRKRFLSKIKLGDIKERSKAQRQAVNSICQGSAADLIKIAMVDIYSVVTGHDKLTSSYVSLDKFQMLRGRCKILLQVHDELVLEVDPTVVKEAGSMLKSCMEGAASLLVPLRVKLQLGKTWGSLQPFEVDEHEAVK